MSDLGGEIFHSFVTHLWDLGKDLTELYKVSHMTPEQLETWRIEEFAKIHKQAIKLASMTSDKQLQKEGTKREDLVRLYEVVLRNRRGLELSQKLLEGMDIRGLDLRKVKQLNQQQIDVAIGDHTTQLPNYLQVPKAWSGRK
jgi:hypothetical protein